MIFLVRGYGVELYNLNGTFIKNLELNTKYPLSYVTTVFQDKTILAGTSIGNVVAAPIEKPLSRKWIEGGESKNVIVSVSKNDSDNSVLMLGRKGIVWLWRANNTYVHDIPHKAKVTSAMFSPHDDHFFLTTGDDGYAKIWSAEDKKVKLTAEFKHESNNVEYGAFSSDGKNLLTITNDGYAFLWNIAEKKLKEVINIIERDDQQQ